MIYCNNPSPTLDEFKTLMKMTDSWLNDEAKKIDNPDYYRRQAGENLEVIVLKAMENCAKDTPFKGALRRTNKYMFPDIIANRLYGVEVKSTLKNHWTTTGSSILESTRVSGVERIYLTFGKLGGDVEFMSRPYEDCMSGITVTHMPRYTIDMKLQKNQSIFDKIGIPYDTLRESANPVQPVKEYYRRNLREGQSLWWITDSPPIIQMWNILPETDRNKLVAYGLTRFTEIFKGDYDAFTFWLAQDRSILCPNIRDQFSAGGQVELEVSFDGKKLLFPHVFIKVSEYAQLIVNFIKQNGEFNGPYALEEKYLKNAVFSWINKVVKTYTSQPKSARTEDEVKSALTIIFSSVGVHLF